MLHVWLLRLALVPLTCPFVCSLVGWLVGVFVCLFVCFICCSFVRPLVLLAGHPLVRGGSGRDQHTRVSLRKPASETCNLLQNYLTLYR